jgi:hypothetical protein
VLLAQLAASGLQRVRAPAGAGASQCRHDLARLDHSRGHRQSTAALTRWSGRARGRADPTRGSGPAERRVGEACLAACRSRREGVRMISETCLPRAGLGSGTSSCRSQSL